MRNSPVSTLILSTIKLIIHWSYRLEFIGQCLHPYDFCQYWVICKIDLLYVWSIFIGHLDGKYRSATAPFVLGIQDRFAAFQFNSGFQLKLCWSSKKKTTPNRHCSVVKNQSQNLWKTMLISAGVFQLLTLKQRLLALKLMKSQRKCSNLGCSYDESC